MLIKEKEEYDDKGNVITRTWYDSEGSVFRSYKYAYADDGSIVSTTCYDSEGNEI